MSAQSNGIIRIGRKGRKKFCIGDGDDAPVFEVDVVEAFQQWLIIDDAMRPEPNEKGERTIPPCDVPAYHARAQEFVKELGGGEVTVAEALEFSARLQEEFHRLAENFRVRLSKEPDSPDTSEQVLHFSEEESPSAPAPSS